MSEKISASRRHSHPAGLYVLSAAEGIERNAFYELMALFTLYLNEALGMSKPDATNWYGNYLAGAYLAALPGGWLAGRVGQRHQWIMAGALLLSAGYWMLGHPRSWLACAVAVLVVGNSLFKPNISALVGALYDRGGRRNEGFAIFYFAINLGGFLGPLLGEGLRSRYGWNAAFGFAAASLMVANVILFAGRRHLPRTTVAAPLQQGPESSQERAALSRALTVLLICSVALIPFWAVFQQSGAALTFWARDNTTRTVLGFEIPPGMYASVNPLVVCMLTVPVARVFSYLARRGLRVSTAWKLLLGVLFVAASFAVMYLASLTGGNTGRVSQAWLCACYVLQTIGELLLY